MNLFEHTVCNLLLARIERDFLKEECAICDGKFADLPNILTTESYRKHLWLKAGSLAYGARRFTHIGLVLFAAKVRVGFGVFAFDET